MQRSSAPPLSPLDSALGVVLILSGACGIMSLSTPRLNRFICSIPCDWKAVDAARPR